MEAPLLVLFCEFLLIQSCLSSCKVFSKMDNSRILNYNQEQLRIICHNITDVSMVYGLSQCNYGTCSDIIFRDSHIDTLTMINPSLNFALNYLKSIYLNDSYIKTIRPGSFNGVWKIEQLHLEHNNLTRVSRGSFITLNRLKWLSLEFNEINDIEDESFLGMTALEHLNLAYNKVNNISNCLFDSLHNLAFLSLSSNPLKTIKFVSKLHALNELYLENTQIDTFDIDIQSKISILEVGHNFLTSIPNLTKIVQLKIGNNSLKMLSKGSLNNFSHLEVLDIHGNQLTSLPKDLFKNTRNLKTLNMSYNALDILEFGLFNGLGALSILDVSNNNLSLLHEESLFSLKALKYLNLSHNKLKSIDLEKILVNSKFLVQILFSNNELQCSEVYSMLQILNKHYIYVPYGNDTDSTHIHGIACINTSPSPGEAPSQANIMDYDREGIRKIFKDEFREFLRNLSDFSERNQYENVNEAIDNLDPRQRQRQKEKISEIENFYSSDFRNTSFYKFFEQFDSLNDTKVIYNSEWKSFLRELTTLWNRTKFYNDEALKHLGDDFKNSSYHRSFSNFTKFIMNYNDTKLVDSLNLLTGTLQTFNQLEIATKARPPVTNLKNISDEIETMVNQVIHTNQNSSELEIIVLVFGCLFIILHFRKPMVKYLRNKKTRNASRRTEMSLI